MKCSTIFNVLAMAAFCTMSSVSADEDQGSNNEQFRPQFHFSPPDAWMNDPNGLVYYRDQWHMFYQKNPYATVWGPMFWGHATSADLVHWTHQAMALRPYGLGTIFSGSTVVDARNVTGFQEGPDIAPLVALYTLHDDSFADGHQAQAMSYSQDGEGLDWGHFDKNPVIANQGKKNFRDPSVFWFEKGSFYVMSLAVGDHAEFYMSTDLKAWTYLSSFGAAPDQGDKTGVWECPSLTSFEVSGRRAWLLMVSQNNPDVGSVTQYFVGDFDGQTFTNENPPEQVNWLDRGPDNYASVPFNVEQVDQSERRAIFIGWMSNWQYAPLTPTSNWRGQMTIPRRLDMVDVGGRLFVKQEPVKEVELLRHPEKHFKRETPVEVSGVSEVNLNERMSFESSLLDFEVVVDISGVTSSSGKVGLKVGQPDGSEYVTLEYDIGKKSLTFDRRSSGKTDFQDTFARTVEDARVLKDETTLTVRLLLDVSSVELFVDGGLNAFTSLFFPKSPYTRLWLTSEFDNSTDRASATFSAYALKSMFEK